jgi:hypothetical protein
MVLSMLLVALVGQTRETRDPWQWPFSRKSIWNMPIGSGARYVPAKILAAGHVGVDEERLIKLSATDPQRPIYAPSSWEKRWPGNTELQYGTMPVPDNLIIPDSSGGNTPNECSAFLLPDGRTVKQLEPTCRVETGKQIVGYPQKDQDIFGPGILGSHWGSGLSTLGGSIRKGELTGKAPIRHAIKLNIWAKQMYYGTDRKGFRWPAANSDSYAKGAYRGKNRMLAMGSLVALSPTLTPASLGLKTAVGRKIFFALQDYGAYLTDDSAWDAVDFCVEKGVNDEVIATYGHELEGDSGDFYEDVMKMIPKLAVIDNNGPSTVGGGGNPRKPLAPPFR